MEVVVAGVLAQVTDLRRLAKVLLWHSISTQPQQQWELWGYFNWGSA